MRSVLAHVSRRAAADDPPADNIEFNGNWKLLLPAHRLGSLAVQLNAAVLVRPPRCAWRPRANEAVFGSDPIMREFSLVEQAAEPVAELVVLLVRNLEQSVLDTKRVAVIV